MNRSTESLLRFLNLSTSGLLAGSLGFGEAALIPGWELERSNRTDGREDSAPNRYLNAIGPVALASSMALAVGARGEKPLRRMLDVVSTLGLAGVLATTTLVTIPIARRIDENRPLDYATEDTQSLTRNWSRAHSLRTTLGITAFVCAAASTVMRRPQRVP
ncbi:MAG: DUF1772 domain-containing protein [Thermoanaerobaculia bacterium]